MKLSECAAITSGTLIGRDLEFHKISVYPLTAIQPDSLVIPCNDSEKEPGFDALLTQSRAAALLLQQPLPFQLPTIVVPAASTTCLINLAAHWRAQFHIPVIGVTGSSGKTTTTALLAHILSQRYCVCASPQPTHSINNLIGLPRIILGMTAAHELAVLEMGINGPDQMAAMAKIAYPQIGIITLIGPVHQYDGFTIADIAREKAQLLEGLSPNGVAIINADDQFFPLLAQRKGERAQLTFGIQHSADVMAKNIQFNEQAYPSLTLCIPDQQIDVTLPLLGKHNVYNALAATAAATVMDVSLPDIKHGLETFTAVQRVQHHRVPNGTTIIHDFAPAQIPDFDAALQVLSCCGADNILVLTGLHLDRELHQDPSEQKQRFKTFGEMAKKAGVKKLYVMGEICQHTIKTFGNKNAYYFTSKEDLITSLKQAITPQTAVLLKGEGMGTVCDALLQ